MKVQTNLSIDEDIKKKSQQVGMDLSEVAERAFREKLKMKEIQIKDICEFCGREEEKASKKTGYIGLTWLCPDEKWICESCLAYKKRNAPIQ